MKSQRMIYAKIIRKMYIGSVESREHSMFPFNL